MTYEQLSHSGAVAERIEKQRVANAALFSFWLGGYWREMGDTWQLSIQISGTGPKGG